MGDSKEQKPTSSGKVEEESSEATTSGDKIVRKRQKTVSCSTFFFIH